VTAGLATAWWFYVVLGVLAGILSGSLGIGGGVLLVPALVFIGHFPQKTAQGMAPAVIVPMALTGAVRYKLNPQIPVDLRFAAMIAVGAVLGALLGATLAARLPAHTLRRLFAVFIFVVALRMFFGPTPAETAPPAHPPPAAAQQAEPPPSGP